jgi:hypothetical protein
MYNYCLQIPEVCFESPPRQWYLCWVFLFILLYVHELKVDTSPLKLTLTPTADLAHEPVLLIQAEMPPFASNLAGGSEIAQAVPLTDPHHLPRAL